MQVILKQDAKSAWLNPYEDNPDRLISLVGLYSAGLMAADGAKPALNKPSFEGPDCPRPTSRRLTIGMVAATKAERKVFYPLQTRRRRGIQHANDNNRGGDVAPGNSVTRTRTKARTSACPDPTG
jgi:hypothetical protein